MKTHLNIDQRCAQRRPHGADHPRRRCTPPENWDLQAHIESRYREGDRYVVIIGVTNTDCQSHQVRMNTSFARCSVRANPFVDAGVSSPVEGCMESSEFNLPPQTEMSIRVFFALPRDRNCIQYTASMWFMAEDNVRGFSLTTTLR